MSFEKLFYTLTKVDHPERAYQTQLQAQFLKHLKLGKSGTLVVATGGGKTKIANDAINEYLEHDDEARVLWITHQWWLLYQAARDYYQRFLRNRGSRFLVRKSKDPELFDFLPEVTQLLDADVDSKIARICYTTVGSVGRTDNSEFLEDYLERFSAIVIDECHWGASEDDRTMYGRVSAAARKCKIPILGLTATRRPENFATIGREISFAELIKGNFLAKPEIWIQDTKFAWSGTGNPLRAGDFKSEFLQDLDNEEYNETIVKTYKRRNWGKTLVFACNIDHANNLLEKFDEINAKAGVIHSQISAEERRSVLQEFQSGKIDVLINVQMVTLGVDIPEIQTIFLARPTASPILYAQMIGRGCRKLTGKDRFNIVEFTGNSFAHFEKAVHGSEFFDSEDYRPTIHHLGRKEKPRPYAKAKRAFKYKSVTKFASFTWGDEESKLPINREQSFGVEIEICPKANVEDYLESESEWTRVANELVDLLKDFLDPNLVADASDFEDADLDLDYEKYNVVYDGSCGWEIVTPILQGADDLAKLSELLENLNESLPEELDVDFSTGLHVHFGFELPGESDALQNFVYNLRFLEPYLALLVAPSRIVNYDPEKDKYNFGEGNEYCESWSQVVDPSELDGDFDNDELEEYLLGSVGEDDLKYMTVNIANLLSTADYGAPKTIEIRMHSGTTNPDKIVPWISLWMVLLEALPKSDEFTGYGQDMPTKIPLPTQREFDEFDEVILDFIGEQNFELLNLLSSRAAEVWELWQEARSKKSRAA